MDLFLQFRFFVGAQISQGTIYRQVLLEAMRMQPVVLVGFCQSLYKHRRKTGEISFLSILMQLPKVMWGPMRVQLSVNKNVISHQEPQPAQSVLESVFFLVYYLITSFLFYKYQGLKSLFIFDCLRYVFSLHILNVYIVNFLIASKMLCRS